jgi:hypothetical protein
MTVRLIKVLLFSLATLALIACGGSGSSGQSDVESDGTSDTKPDDVADAIEDTVTPPPDTPPASDTDPPPDLPPPPPDTTPPPEPVDPMVCTGTFDGELQEFGGSCCYTPAWHQKNPDCVWYGDSFGSGACLHGQCETSLCTRPASHCTQSCLILKDLKNNANADPEPDGVEDDDESGECSGAVDGPVGNVFRCVNRADANKNQQGRCLPGTTFAACESNKDCPAGETCTLQYIHGKTQSRCTIPDKAALPMSSECNGNPNDGPVTKCGGPFCYGSGCVDLCSENSDCATDTCVEGKCSKNADATCESDTDCSAWECRDLQPYSDSDYSDTFCLPRTCKAANDCHDPDWFCQPFWNSADTVEEVELAPSCRRKPAGTANYGEACGVEGDGTNLPACVWGNGCIDNVCSGPCQSDADCDAGSECLQAYQWNIDVEDDGTDDTTVNLDLCVVWPHDGDLTACTTDADCATDHHCQYRIKGDGLGTDRKWAVEYYCRKDAADQVTFAQECGGDSGKKCASDLCLTPSGSSNPKPMCTEYCTGAADCSSSYTFDGSTWKGVCLSFNVNKSNTPDEIDDLFVPYCWRTSPFGSVEPCGDENKCSKSKEYCRAYAIAGNPDEKVKVEHLCLDVGQGLSEYPTKKLGESCTQWQECLGRVCLSDGEGGKYCSELCQTDAGCANEAGLDDLACTETVLIPRPDEANSGVSHRCVLKKQCMACEDDTNCGGDFVCGNFGGLGFLADLRCGPECGTDADCTDPTTTCQDDIDDTGLSKGRKVCMSDQCP